MQSILYRIQFQKLFIVAVCLSVLSGNFSPLAAQTRRAASVKKAPTTPAPTVTKTSSAPQENSFLSSDSKTALSGAWTSGELPPPMAVPGGNPDEIAATLARKVAAKSDESIPALLAALQFSGFFITDKNGQVTLAPADGKGQGLAINGWEVASVAKMFGEGKSTTLKDLSEHLKAIPYFRQRDVAPMIANGVRSSAENSKNPYLRMWARFIVELGRNSPRKSDLTAVGAKPEETEIDAIQHLLLMRRLYGDLWSRTQLWKARIGVAKVESPKSQAPNPTIARFVGASFKPEEIDGRETEVNPRFTDLGLGTSDSGLIADETQQSKIPCRMDGNAPTVMDAGATVAGFTYGEILDMLEELYEDTPTEKAIQKFAMFQAVTNIILAYAKFIQTYAALETKIILEGAPPLYRTKNALAGERKPLRAEVRMNIGNWQMYNCIRMAMNVTVGIDFATLNDGPLGDVGVTWHLHEGDAFERYSNSTGVNKNGEQFVGITQQGIKRIQEKGVGVDSTTNANYTKTDEKGIARVILEGTPQRNAKIGRVFEVTKQARVSTSIKIKAGEIKGDLVDAIGQALGGVGGLLTMPTELLYRTSWFASAAIVVPVIDWEECEGGWSGTISVSARWKDEGQESSAGHKNIGASNKSFMTKKWTRSYAFDGAVNIKNSPSRTSGSTVSAKLRGTASATSERKWNDKYHFSDVGECGWNRFVNTYHDAVTEEVNRGAFEGEVKGNLHISLENNTYSFDLLIPELGATGKKTGYESRQGYCAASINKTININEEKSLMMGGMHIEVDDGVLNPKNPDYIEGVRTFKKPDGTEMEIRWSLRRCR